MLLNSQTHSRARGLPAADRRSGQSMVLAIVFIPIIFITALILFNVSQVSTEKQKLQNTVDAMTYSVALMEARDLNFAAYMNRAMVSNQVAVAQGVSLVSWARYVASEIQAFADFLWALEALLWWVPGVDVVIGGLAEIFEDAEEMAQDFQEALAETIGVVVSALDVWLKALSLTEQVFHFATVDSGLETLFAVQNKNDPTTKISMLGGMGGVAHAVDFYACFSTRAAAYSGNDISKAKPYLKRFAEASMKARDGFSANRSHVIPIHFLSGDIIPGWVQITTSLERRGGADFDQGLLDNSIESWYTPAVDSFGVTVDIFADAPVGMKWVCDKYCKTAGHRWCCWGHPEIEYKWEKIAAPNFSAAAGFAYSGQYEPLPLNYATAPGPWTGSPPKNPFSFGYGEAVSEQSEGVLAGYVEYGDDEPSIGTYSGMQSYISIRKTSEATTDSADIILQIQKPATSVMTSDNVAGLGRGTYDLSAQAQANIYAVAKASAHFSRANWPRKDGKIEYGNLFNPYWEAKLVDLTDDEQKAVATWDNYNGNPGDIFKDLQNCLMRDVQNLDFNFMDCFNSGGAFPGADIVNAIKNDCTGK